MRPLKLTLEGFTGIRSGRGKDSLTIDLTTIPANAQLVALVGPNGNGKTTILDNLHPYRVMPSRSTTLGPTGFSYWDHLCMPAAKKDLEWEHEGRRYMTSIAFKSTAKTRKSDCFLFVWEPAHGKWEPVRLNDGTLSDGKTDTYDRCVDTILGIPETFFTSAFSAQCRKSISAYGNSEVKALLASILEHEDLRTLSVKAGTVGKHLRVHLESLQDRLAQARGAEADIEAARTQLRQLEARMQDERACEQTALAKLDEQRKALALREAKRDAQAQDEEQRTFIGQQITKSLDNAAALKANATRNADAEIARLTADRQKAEVDLAKAVSLRSQNEEEMRRLAAVVAQGETIRAACIELPALQQELAGIDSEHLLLQGRLAELRPLRLSMQADVEAQTRIHTTANGKIEAIARLKETSALIEKVPCSGSQLQQRCPLLENAHKAREDINQQEAILVDMRAQYRTLRTSIEGRQEKLNALDDLEAKLGDLSTRRITLANRISELSRLSGMRSMLEEATQRLPVLEESKQQFAIYKAETEALLSGFVEKVAECRRALAVEITRLDAAASSEVSALKARLSQLSAPVTEFELAGARRALQAAGANVESVRVRLQGIANEKVTLLATIDTLRMILEKLEATKVEATRISDEIASWKLLEKGMGNDGLIALSIDDAGPEIATLCNDLLRESYDARFAIRIDTQTATQAGGLKETFEVTVRDQHTGDEKSLKDMSPGERTWVNECLTRAIALYVGESQGVQFHTLFTDEADGALDADRKRQFMQMKRAVLARGGYEREYFISQTPELWEMADHIIDVTTL
jgi:exonuclease SbcC